MVDRVAESRAGAKGEREEHVQAIVTHALSRHNEALRCITRHSKECFDALALQEFLGTTARRHGRPADRVRRLIGSLESGVPDLARKHRAYVLESLKHGR